LSHDEVQEKIHTLFRCDDPNMWRLTVDAYHQCILGGLRPPDPPLEYVWLSPGGQYRGQWLWDTMFVVDLLSILPDQRDTIRGIFQNYWDFQKRWNSVMPEYAHGMVANFIEPYSVKGNDSAWKENPAYSQAPLLAWGMERVYRRNGDTELLRTGIGHLEPFHEWYWRERDLNDVGLVCVGTYSDDVQHARYETYDSEVDLDRLTLTKHPKRNVGGKWYGDICIPANTSYLLLSEASLSRMAIVVGDHAMAHRRDRRLRKGVAAMRKHMWDDAQGCFLSVRRDSLEKIPIATIGGLVPLQAHIPTARQAARMAEVLSTSHWATPLPVPTVDRQNPNFGSHSYWRGDVWPATNYQIAAGLASYGFRDLAAYIADKMLEDAIRVGISEHYDSLTGEPHGVRGLGMSAAMLTMALDGVTKKLKLLQSTENERTRGKSASVSHQ
jgi:putative isomerase